MFTIDETDTDFVVLSKPDVHLTWPDVEAKLVPFDVIESYSGDFYKDQQEITWDKLTADCQSTKPIMECTTLTKLPRRVATFSKQNLREAIVYNQTNHKMFISVNFSNYVDIQMYGQNRVITPKFKEWLNKYVLPVVNEFGNAKLKFVGTSPNTEDMILFE